MTSPQSPQQHVVERFSVSKDGKVLTERLPSPIEDHLSSRPPDQRDEVRSASPTAKNGLRSAASVDLEYLKTMDLNSSSRTPTPRSRACSIPPSGATTPRFNS